MHVLLRSYTGLFTDFAYINEDQIAKRLGWTHHQVYEGLVALSKEQIIQYIPRKKTPFLTFTHEREDVSRVKLGKEAYDDRRGRYVSRVKSVLDYAQEETICRSQILLSYFGEKNSKPCGKCDICRKNSEKSLNDEEFETIKNRIFYLLNQRPYTMNELISSIQSKEVKIKNALRFLSDNNSILMNDEMKFFKKPK